jgi:1-acyl-sn-glycerol-3-phosphate acyltransferase
MVLSLTPASKHALSRARTEAMPAFSARERDDLWEDGRPSSVGAQVHADPPCLRAIRVAARKSLLLSLRNVVETLAISVPTVVDGLRGTLTRSRSDDRLERWARRIIASTGMTISVHGRENAPPEHLSDGGIAWLVMSNHQSHYDIAVLFYVLGPSLRMVAKRELFELPLFGRAMREAGFIAIDRQNRTRALASLEDAKALLAAGTPIWIAPEGTRSITGELLPFKWGGFALALESGAKILPVTLRGTRDALRAKGVRSRTGAHVTVSIHPPVDPARFASLPPPEARRALAEEVRLAIASGL